MRPRRQGRPARAHGKSNPATAKPPALAGGFWLFRCASEASRVICAAGFPFHAVSVVGLFALHDPGDRGEPVPRAALCGVVLTLRALAALCHRRHDVRVGRTDRPAADLRRKPLERHRRPCHRPRRRTGGVSVQGWEGNHNEVMKTQRAGLERRVKSHYSGPALCRTAHLKNQLLFSKLLSKCKCTLNVPYFTPWSLFR